MPDYTLPLDSTFQALADPTRRAVVQRLSMGPASVTELSKPFNMALQSFVQHLGVLEESGLICSEKIGRVRTCRIVPDQLSKMEKYLLQLRQSWEQSLDNLEEYLNEPQKKKYHGQQKHK